MSRRRSDWDKAHKLNSGAPPAKEREESREKVCSPRPARRFKAADATAGYVPSMRALPDDVVVGRNAVREALKSGRGINKLLLAEGQHGEAFCELLAAAQSCGVPTETVPRDRIKALAAGHRHQGVLAYAAPVPYAALEDILAKVAAKEGAPLLLLLDGLEDPHNLGALLRTADAAGVDGVMIPQRRSCPLSATVAKTAAGAVEYVPVARVGNVVQTIKKLKAAGFWVAGADMDGTQVYYETDFTGALVLVIGGEGRGLSRLTKENCDFLVRLPMAGHINSLNASVAGAILLYEALRQRLVKPRL